MWILHPENIFIMTLFYKLCLTSGFPPFVLNKRYLLKRTAQRVYSSDGWYTLYFDGGSRYNKNYDFFPTNFYQLFSPSTFVSLEATRDRVEQGLYFIKTGRNAGHDHVLSETMLLIIKQST